jgi:hypothetical protein
MIKTLNRNAVDNIGAVRLVVEAFRTKDGSGNPTDAAIPPSACAEMPSVARAKVWRKGIAAARSCSGQPARVPK